MSDPTPARSDAAGGAELNDLSREDRQSALFAQLVMQQANLAFMLMGKVPHPESGESLRDFGAAQVLIDQLEMLETKTRGNLNPHEAALLKQSLMALRLGFVEAVNAPAPAEKPAPPESPPAETGDKPAPLGSDDEAAKRFSKKYSP